jgi:hypothetical protein
MVLFGIAGIFFALSVYQIFLASSITLLVSNGVSCDLCPLFTSITMTNAVIYAIAGAIAASVGAWLVISGRREEKAKLST